MVDIKGLLSVNDQTVIAQVTELFRTVDQEAARLQAATGVHCPAGCGRCCVSAPVETTAIEMLPLAVDLWQRGEADVWLQRIAAFPRPDRCAFFEADPSSPGQGRCAVYALRPLVCRLFGFFTVRDKHGRYVYGGCRVIRERSPADHQRMVDLVAGQPHPSLLTDYSIRIISMGTELGRDMVPINAAARTALEKIGFDIQKRAWPR